MTGSELPQSVRYLLARHIESVQQLEILRLLAQQPDRGWAPDEVSRTLRIAPDSCESWLRRFAEAGLVAYSRDAYRHGTPDGGAAGPVDLLLECFGSRRLSVLGFLYSKPESDGNSAVP